MTWCTYGICWIWFMCEVVCNDSMLWYCTLCVWVWGVYCFHQGYTALLLAAEYHPTVVQALIEAKSDLTATDRGVSIVICCVFDSSLERSLGIHSCDITCFDMALRMLDAMWCDVIGWTMAMTRRHIWMFYSMRYHGMSSGMADVLWEL